MRFINYIFPIIALLLGVLVIIGFYETFHQVDILQVHNEPVPVIGDTLTPGQPLILKMDFCKFTNDPAVVTPELIGVNVPNRYLPSFISDVRQGCYNQQVTVGSIPLSASAGTYTVHLVIQYENSVLHHQFITVESQPFDVGNGHIIYLN